MNWRVLIGSLVALAVPHIAVAVPPPPPPPKYTESWKAIEALSSYLGKWTGTEVQHSNVDGKMHNSERRVFWNVSRLGGRDIIVFEHGINSSPPYTDFYNVMTYDTSTSSYRMFLAGYRLFIGSNRTSELAPIACEPDGRLSWSATKDDGSKRRTSLWLDGGAWHEKVEDVGADGSRTPVSDAIFTKS